MQHKIVSRVTVVALCILTVLDPPAVSAGGFDGSSNVVCAAIDVVACTEGTVCSQGQAKTFDLPQFLIIGFKQNFVRATEESGHKQVSTIRNVEQTGSQMILQGVETGQRTILFS